MNITAAWNFDKGEQRKHKLDRLLKAAATCFNEKGFSGTSLKDVANQLNITDAAIYYYVRNKEELVNLCYLKATDLAEDALDRAMQDGASPSEKLALFIGYQIDHLTGAEGPVAVMSEIPALAEEHREAIRARATRHQKRITQLIQEGAEDGSLVVVNPIATSNVILGALNWMPKWYKPSPVLSVDMIKQSFVSSLMGGIRSQDL